MEIKKSLIGLAVLGLIFSGCTEEKTIDTETPVVEKKDENTVDKVANGVISHVESTAKKAETLAKNVQESASPVVKDIANKVKDVQKEISETTLEDAKTKITDVTAPLIKKVQDVVLPLDGKALYKKCAGCHGSSAEKKALNKSEIIQNWDKQAIVDALKGYKNGTYGGAMKGVMKSQTVNLSDDEINALAKYITDLK